MRASWQLGRWSFGQFPAATLTGNMKMMRLESMLRAARADQPGAWAALSKALTGELRGYFRVLTSSEDEARDLAQTAVMRALENLHTAKSEETLEAWVFGVARNVWREKRRSHARRERLRDDVAVVADVQPAGLSTVFRRTEMILVMGEEVEKLPDRLREVVELELAEADPQEFVERRGIADSTYRRRRSEARALLRKRLVRRMRTTPTRS